MVSILLMIVLLLWMTWIQNKFINVVNDFNF